MREPISDFRVKLPKTALDPIAAHSRNAKGIRHDLVAHLRGVAKLAAGFAEPFGAAEISGYAGLGHDIGKAPKPFQTYLAYCELHPDERKLGPDHKGAGCLLAADYIGAAAMTIQGHHGGLRSVQEFRAFLNSAAKDPNAAQAIAWATSTIPELRPRRQIEFPAFAEQDPLCAELFVRMVFSALVDSDYLDTEAHFDAERSAVRYRAASLNELWTRFQADQKIISGQRQDIVSRVRQNIYQACLDAADVPPGLFRLRAPTGGGKTRSAMAFGLKHALRHGLERIIVAVPYISITTQTAAVYRQIFGAGMVLEHHSGVHPTDDEAGDCYSPEVWSRLATENWDAPIIVTTTVQLFESLFSNRTSDTRKLHHLVRSVIVLDEAQCLPGHLLTPILDALRELCAHYGSTVVLSTATQPALEAIPGFATLEATEIVSDSDRFFPLLDRVEYSFPNQLMTWTECAEVMRSCEQCLAVVNTKADALALLDALDDPAAVHLSTNLCGAHRAAVIESVRARLASGGPCRLVSTQVIEAGVDIDFPLVLRAIGPLDSIIQSAGRCNREARLDKGRVVVFRPAEGRLPPGFYRTATGITEALLNSGAIINPERDGWASTYFRRLFRVIDTDREHVQEWRARLDYPEVSRRFRMIDDDTESVVVQYGSSRQQARVRSLIEQLRGGTPAGRYIMRELQPYLVSVLRRDADKYRARGLIVEITDGLGEWLAAYDSVRGLTATE